MIKRRENFPMFFFLWYYKLNGVDKMTLSFRKIDHKNWRQINSLKVGENQTAFVASNVTILARAYAYRESNSQVLGLYYEDTAIGLLMERDYSEDSISYCVLDQLMIDEKYQNQGYARAFLNIYIDRVLKMKKYNYIMLCYDENDKIAEKLYRSLAFVRKREYDDGNELVMIYDLSKV